MQPASKGTTREPGSHPTQKKESPQHGTIGQDSKQNYKKQFGVIDAKGEARSSLKNMKQGKRSVTEYWNEFRLVASQAELDDSTGGELLLGGMIAELQNAWGNSSEEY